MTYHLMYSMFLFWGTRLESSIFLFLQFYELLILNNLYTWLYYSYHKLPLTILSFFLNYQNQQRKIQIHNDMTQDEHTQHKFRMDTLIGIYLHRFLEIPHNSITQSIVSPKSSEIQKYGKMLRLQQIRIITFFPNWNTKVHNMGSHLTTHLHFIKSQLYQRKSKISRKGWFLLFLQYSLWKDAHLRNAKWFAA